MKRTHIIFAVVLLTAAAPVAQAAGPGAGGSQPSNGAAIPKPCGCPPGAGGDVMSAVFGQGGA